MRAETMFKEYWNMKRELSVLEIQLMQFEGVKGDELIETLCFSHPVDDVRVQTSGTSDKTAKIALNYKEISKKLNSDWFDYLIDRKTKVVEEISFFEYSIRFLKGNLETFVTDLVLEEMKWEKLMDKYNVSHSMVAKYRQKAIKELDKMYELRDLQTYTYMLS